MPRQHKRTEVDKRKGNTETMIIKALKLYKGGFMTQPFAFGGEDGMDKFDPSVKYRSSLQNFLIDTGKEVILVDTGLPDEFPEHVPDEKTMIYMGSRIKSYDEVFAEAGYKPEQVSKILITHKHSDHTGKLKSFPNAEIYVGPEDADAPEFEELKVIKAEYNDGPYHNFPASQKIADGIYLIQAKGHTKGNSIVIAESEGLFYMMHGDVTYTDEALYENKLSVVFEDKAAARQTLDMVREFIKNNPTVYLSTHTPLGYENLDGKKTIDLANPPASIPPGEITFKTASGKYVCGVCGYVYDPAKGDPERGIAAGTPFEQLPPDWHCPRCRKDKSVFNKA